jgi:RNA polymerase sigma factor (sigma-70 family)
MTTLIYPYQNNTVRLTNEQLETILNGCILNQRAAQKEIYCIYYNYTMSIALQYSSGYDNAIEMTNDAFLKVYRGLKKFTPRYNNTIASFTAWLKKVAVNACIDHAIKYNKKEVLSMSVDYAQVLPADEQETAEQMLHHKEIIQCVQQLTPAYKTVFNLYVIEGFTHAEIAYKLNISEGTSKSNLFKAKENLRQLLKRNNIMRCA